MKKFILFILIFSSSPAVMAQSGNFIATFTPESGAKPVTITFTKPMFRFDEPYGYWFVNPHNGARHLQLSPPPGYGSGNVAFIIFNGKDDDVDLFALTSNDSDEVTIKNNSVGITAPEYDPKMKERKPMHIHFTTFTNAEVAFTISGNAGITSLAGNGSFEGFGAITATGHFYREPKFTKSELMPGCDCDPTIYATAYDKENYIRTASACENALFNKLFDAAQRSFAPLYNNLAYKGSSTMSPGQISITNMAGHVNTDVPVKERAWCSSDWYHNRNTGFDAEKKIFSNDDAYGVRFIEMPAPHNTDNLNRVMTEQSHIMDSAGRLMSAGKISAEAYQKLMENYTAKMTDAGSEWDIKKDEKNLNLYISIVFNTATREIMPIDPGDKNQPVVKHSVPGSSFEIFSPMVKDGDGDWVANKYYVYLGKFSAPAAGKSAGGYDEEIAAPVYPPNANKLTIYNIVVKMEGGKDLIDKALATMDFNALEALILKQ